MCVAPVLYDYGFGGRYQLALEVLPLTLMQATWVSLYLLCQAYLLCAERGKMVMGVLAAGLVVNFVLNYFLIKWFGLQGALMATAVSTACVLSCLLWRLNASGIRFGWGTVLACLSTLAIAAGSIVAALVLTLCVVIAGRTNWLLSEEDRVGIDQALLPRLQRMGLRLPSIWP